MRCAAAVAAAVASALVFAATAGGQNAGLAQQQTLAYVKATKTGTDLWIDWSVKPAIRIAGGTNPQVSHRGTQIAYVKGVGGPLLLASTLPGAAPVATSLKHVWNADAIRWSPDDRFLSVVTGPELGPYTLQLLDVATGTLRPLQKGFFFGVSFSPDGTALAWGRAAKESLPLKADLYRADLAGGAVTALTTTQNAAWPVWGPQTIAFARSRRPERRHDAPKQDIWTIAPDGTGLKRVTKTRPPFLISGPRPVAWSADGTRLLASYEGQDTSEAWRVDPASGAAADLTGKFDGVAGFALSADGARVLGVSGGADTTDGDVVSVDWLTGRRTVLVRRAFTPSWNA